MNEIELVINGVSEVEYYSNSIPRVGEYIDISHEHISGYFKVMKVTHRVFQKKKTGEVLSYVIVEAEATKY